MVLGSSPVAVTLPSDFVPASSKEFLDIQATIECGFTLKRIRDMTRTYSQTFIIIVVLYLFQNTYTPFLMPCSNIIQCIVYNVWYIVYNVKFLSLLLLQLCSYLYESIEYYSFEMLLLLHLFLFNGKIR